MKKIFLFIIPFIAFIGCDKPKPKSFTQKEERIMPIEAVIDTFLHTLYLPRKDHFWVSEDTIDKWFLGHLRYRMRQQDLLKENPVQFIGINRKGNKNMVMFRSAIPPIKFSYKNMIFSIYYDLLGEVNDSVAKSLNKYDYYEIEGSYIAHFNNRDDFIKEFGAVKMVNDEKVSIHDINSAHLGMIHYNITKIVPFTGRHIDVITYYNLADSSRECWFTRGGKSFFEETSKQNKIDSTDKCIHCKESWILHKEK